MMLLTGKTLPNVSFFSFVSGTVWFDFLIRATGKVKIKINFPPLRSRESEMNGICIQGGDFKLIIKQNATYKDCCVG